MKFSNIKRTGILTAAAVASLQAASVTLGAPTIYFTGGGSAPGLTPLTDSGSPTNSANQGLFSPSDLANSILSVTPSGGVYIPAFANDINSSGTGDASNYVKIGGFLSPPGNIFVALKLDNNGTAILASDTTKLNAIDADINGSNTNVTASLLNSTPVAGVFPGYDIVLEFPDTFTSGLTVGSATQGEYDFGFDFGGYSNSDAGVGTVTVTDIGVVPEPGCLGILTAAGWVLFPRYRRYRRA